jgi:bacteriocin-like protein
MAMTDMNRNEAAGSYHTLSEDELNAVAGGGDTTGAPSQKPAAATLFEVKDYSFDV